MVFPSTIPRAHAVLSNGNNFWAPIGPSVDNLLYTVYADYPPMFTAFASGQLDYTDWPVQAGDLSSFVNNPDFFVTCTVTGGVCGGEAEFGTFQLDINHGDPLFGVGTVDNWQTARVTGTPALVVVSTGGTCSPACPASTFQLTIQLQNLEESNAAVLDGNNQVTATISGTSSTVVSKADDGGSAAPTGSYSLGFLSDATGISGYSIATTIYSGSPTLPTSGAGSCAANTACTFALRVNYNSGSTLKPSTGGIDLGRALWHMLNKPQFMTGPYLNVPPPLGACMDVFAPPAQGLMSGGVGACATSSDVPNSVLTAECSDTNIAALLTAFSLACAPSSLYVLKSNIVNGAPSCGAGTVGISCFPSQSASPPTGYPSNVDLAASCIYFMEAGFTTTGTGSITAQCMQVASGSAHLVNPNAGGCNTATAAGCVIMYIRTHPPRKAFGTIVADTINYMFGTSGAGGGTVCYGGPPSLACSLTPIYFHINDVANIVFDTSVVKDWNLYTGGNGFGSTPDGNLHDVPESDFAGTYCNPNATPNTGPNDYNLWCDPKFDSQSLAGEFVPGITVPAFQQAAIIFSTESMNIPVYSGANLFAALNSWNQQQVGAGTGFGVVTTKGHGIEASYANLMNAHPVQGYVPSNNLFCASGPQTGLPAGAACDTSVATTLRRGTSQPLTFLSPYVFDTVWEGEILNQFYDSLLAVNPNTGGLCSDQPGGTSQCFDWLTQDPGGVPVPGHKSYPNTPVAGETTWVFNLRNDISFTDNVPVTAHDICFSVLSFRDAPSRLLASSVSNVLSCSASGQVASIVVSGLSPFTELNLGGIYIVPEHIWAPLCGGVSSGDACLGVPPNTSTPACPATPAGCPGATALASRSFDPAALGYLVGEGAWVCNTSLGVSTIAGQASCTQNANGSPGGQNLGAGGRISMKANSAYFRGFQTLSAGKSGTGGLAWASATGFEDIGAIAHTASCFDSTPARADWPSCFQYAWNPDPSNCPSPSTCGAHVQIGDIATGATFFQFGINGGQTLNSLVTSGAPPYTVTGPSCSGDTGGKTPLATCAVSSTTSWTVSVSLNPMYKIHAYRFWLESPTNPWSNTAVVSSATVITSASHTFAAPSAVGTWKVHIQLFTDTGATKQYQNIDVVIVTVT